MWNVHLFNHASFWPLVTSYIYVDTSGAEPDLVQRCWLQRRKRRKRREQQSSFHLFYEMPYTMAPIQSVHTCKHSTITFESLRRADNNE